MRKSLSFFETEVETESYLLVISNPILYVWACQILSKDDKIFGKINQNSKDCSMTKYSEK